MCYTVPLAAGITTTFICRKNRSIQMWWLNLLFYGGSLFGLVDHLWNGELFLISKDWVSDLALGVVITAVIFLAWRIILAVAKKTFTPSAYILANPENK